jgi:hypothetical protein
LHRRDVVAILELRSLFEPVFLPQLPIGHNSSEPSAHLNILYFLRWTDIGFIVILAETLDSRAGIPKMEDAERFRLLGKYRTPRFRIGRTVFCEVRGEMVITGMTDALIPWPVGKKGRGRHSLIVFKDLAKAVRRESNQAVAHWWSVDQLTVTKWRKTLSVGIVTAGTHRLFCDYKKEPWAIEALAKAQSKARDPERRRKIAEARRGKPRPQHVLDAMHTARRGLKHTEETRRRMSEAHRSRGTLVPGTVPWTAEEEELVRTLPAEEVARRTGRSL